MRRLTGEGAWWGYVIVAFCGTLCVSGLHWLVLGHGLWVVSNTGLLACALVRRQWQSVAMWGGYLALSVWGLVSWGMAA